MVIQLCEFRKGQNAKHQRQVLTLVQAIEAEAKLLDAMGSPGAAALRLALGSVPLAARERIEKSL